MRTLILILLFFIVSCTSDPSTHKIDISVGLPVVSVTINDETVKMIMDTGGAVTVIDNDYLKRLKLKNVIGGRDIIGYGGERYIQMTDQQYIQMGNSKMYDNIYSSNLEGITVDGIVGILGIGHLSSVGAKIDLEKMEITVE